MVGNKARLSEITHQRGKSPRNLTFKENKMWESSRCGKSKERHGETVEVRQWCHQRPQRAAVEMAMATATWLVVWEVTS
ncbi:hypothetical protein RRG08_001981 [Elysia crispata]|uniref:Uncharacterized protein n=1 Tax=Elysia crispata TaxID=231223 RepID=A0AAE1BAE2_9GAST|nr:hypothetical protein RRG08_001981 [Elysia crispata]